MVHLFQSFEKKIENIDTAKKVAENSRRTVITTIKASKNNTGTIKIGGQNCQDNGFPLEAGESLDGLIIPLLDEVYFSGSVLGDKIHIVLYDDPHIHNIRETIFEAFGQEYLARKNGRAIHDESRI